MNPQTFIDAHVHITHNGKWFSDKYNASLERLLDEMEEAKIEKAVLIPLPGVTTNEYIASVIEKYPYKFKGIGYIDFSYNIVKQIDNINSMGLVGIKIHPRLQGIDICRKKYNFLWKYLNKKKMKLIIDTYPQVTHNKLTIQKLLPLAYEGHIKKFKDITVILAHAGGHRVLDSHFLCRSNNNCYCDISYSINAFKGSSVYNDLRFLMENTNRKILFGSDFPEISIIQAKKAFLSLTDKLTEDILFMLSFSNAEKVFWNEK